MVADMTKIYNENTKTCISKFISKELEGNVNNQNTSKIMLDTHSILRNIVGILPIPLSFLSVFSFGRGNGDRLSNQTFKFEIIHLAFSLHVYIIVNFVSVG